MYPPEAQNLPISQVLSISHADGYKLSHGEFSFFSLLTGDVVSFLCLVPSEDCTWLGGIFFLVSSGILRKHKPRSFLCRKV